MTSLLISFVVAGILMFVVPAMTSSRLRDVTFTIRGRTFNPQFNIVGWAIRGAGVLVLIFGIASTSYVHVPDGYYGQVFRTYAGGELKDGKIVAIKGENGPQGYVLRPGFHFSPLLNVINHVETSKKQHVVEDGKVGVLVALDGAPLRPGQAFADPFPADKGLAMLDAETFLNNKGQRGAQLTVLTPGTYVLNDYLWKVENRPMKDVETGFTGVVRSNVHSAVDFGTLKSDKPSKCDVISATDPTAQGRIEAPLVPVGCVGVWQAALQPGKYPINPDAYTIIPIDTRAQVWTYAGGYERCGISLEVDSKGEIKQNRKCEPVKFDEKNDADRAVFVKMEGWDVPLELRVVAQVSPSKASCVVAGVGTLKEIEDRVLTPSIRAIVRDVSGGTYDVEEAKVDENNKPILVEGKPQIVRVKRPTKVTDLINQRPLIEGEIENRIRPEAEKSCVSIREVRLGEPAIPPELLVAVRREQLATQLSKAYIQEQGAQTQRVESEKAKSTADQQVELVKADIEVQRSERQKKSRLNEGEGERDKLQAIAAGQRAQLEVLGKDDTVNLRKFELTLNTLVDFFGKHPEVLTAALTNAHKFVPNVQVGATNNGDGINGLFAGMLANTVSQSQPTPVPAAPPAAPPPAIRNVGAAPTR